MAPFKQHMYQHLRSAKQFLIKAEEAFGKEHDIRGELDLMLAQAELQRVAEVNRSRHWRYRYVIFRHGLALTLAIVMAVGAGGIYWWTNRPSIDKPVPLTGTISVSADRGTKMEGNFPPILTPNENVQTVKPVSSQIIILPTSRGEQLPEVEQPRNQSEQPAPLSADEKQKLMRAAGKTLRGQ